jgi:hypothetical protein
MRSEYNSKVHSKLRATNCKLNFLNFSNVYISTFVKAEENFVFEIDIVDIRKWHELFPLALSPG